MSRRRATASLVANPVLVGAVTTLVVVVAVFLAYNANSGLPFVPTTQYFLEVDNGSNLVPGNEIREGGFRVGVVEEMEPVVIRDSKGTTRAGAQLKIKLDQTAGRLPVDTKFAIRPRSALGLQYVEISRGTSDRLYEDGDTIPASAGRIPVQLDEFYGTFDRPTREGAQATLLGSGNTFAGRGTDLNITIGELDELFGFLTPVMENLSAPETRLREFFGELADSARVVAPVADVQAQLFTDLADTFEALARDEGALAATIERAPETLRVGTESLRAQRPFLDDLAAASVDLNAAVSDLRAALPVVNPALREGIPVLRRSVELNEELEATMTSLNRLVRAPQTNRAVRALTDTVTTLNPQLRWYLPFVSVCNYWNLFWTGTAEHVSEGDPTGTSQRALLNTTGRQEHSIGEFGASEPANGEGVIEGNPQYFHGQPYGRAVNPDGTADCESGQRGFPERLNQYGDPRMAIAIDPRTPGSQGPLFDRYNPDGSSDVPLGRRRVPSDATFTPEPETGPVLAPNTEDAEAVREDEGGAR